MSSPIFEDLRILLIDDRTADRALAVALLRDHLSGARIREVNGAIDFAEVLGYRAWSVAVATGDLEWADGAELLRAVKQHHPQCQTILFAKEPPDEMGTLGDHAGVDAYVRKESAGYLRLPALIRQARGMERSGSGSAISMRAGIDMAPVGYFWVRAEGTILEANRALANLVGVDDPQRLKDRSLLEFVADPRDRAALERSLMRNLREQVADIGLTGTDGAIRRCSLGLWPAPDEEGRACLEGMVWALGMEPDSERNLVSPLPLAPAPRDPAPDSEDTPAPAAPPPPSAAIVTPIRGPRTDLEPEPLGAPVPRETLEPVPLKDPLLAALARLRPLLAESHARVRAGLLPTLRVDRSEMIRLFRELAENALEYRGDAPPIIHVRAEEQIDGWLVSVEDNGPGMPSEVRRALFSHLRTNISGHPGSGLAICRQIAQRYGGDLWLTSERARGTTVFVALKTVADSASPETSLTVQFNGEDMGSIGVLNIGNEREIARAALALPKLKRRIGERAIKQVQFVAGDVVNIVA